MKRFVILSSAAAAAVFLLCEPAYANEPPAPQTFLAQILIIPIAFALFAFSGAAALYDRRELEALKASGKVRKHSPRRGRIRILLGVVLATILCGAHEGFAALVSPVFAVYAVVIAIRMFRASSDAPAGSYSRWASRVAGVLLVPTAVFLASFSFFFISSSDTYRYPGEYSYLDTLEEFWTYQRNYAKSHDGRYLRIEPSDPDKAGDGEMRYVLVQSRAGALYDMMRRGEERCSIEYGDDLRSYEVAITPLGFLPWPYRWFTSRKAYFMDHTGTIRYEEMSSPGKEASPESPVLKNLTSGAS